ncbi:MAG: hypothetical protein K2L96_01495 [Muribaculaceae bacterium]|nr:hypothetical protein [Muribaculaceae bacterium]
MGVLEKIGATLKGATKVLLLSRPSGAGRCKRRGGRIFILGNGPSLREALEKHGQQLAGQPCLGVNFALNSPEITALRPTFYVLADPHFFRTPGSDANVDKLWHNLRATDWDMRLYVPARYASAARQRLGDGSKTMVKAFNAVGVEGFESWTHAVYSLGLGMPRPRNVLIPSLMLAIREGFDEIIVLGADHSWMKTIGVTEENEVVSIQPHFYAEDSREESRVRHEYRGYRLHEIVESFAVAFRAYHQIGAFARSRGALIVNATPGSFIDAFPRTTLEKIFSDTTNKT